MASPSRITKEKPGLTRALPKLVALRPLRLPAMEEAIEAVQAQVRSGEITSFSFVATRFDGTTYTYHTECDNSMEMGGLLIAEGIKRMGFSQ